jgi:cytochrome c
MKRSVRSIFAAAFLALCACSAYAQNVENGRRVFAACSACHETSQESKLAPSLAGVVGRHAGALDGFAYSRAMRRAGLVWNERNLNAYLADPQTVIPGNRMPFAGIVDPQDRADLIAFLKTLK